MAEKRVVPPVLQKLLQFDIKLTSVFCHAVERILPPTKNRKFLKVLEVIN